MRPTRLLVAVLVGTMPLPVVAARTSGPKLDVQAACPRPGALPPEHASLAGVSDDGAEVTLSVVVGLDGIDRARAREVFAKAREAYEPLAIELRTRFVAAPTTATDTSPSGGPAIDVHVATQSLRARLGGRLPKRFDVAYLATDKDLYVVENGAPNYGYGGFAECIGGVRDPFTAFAVGEAAFADEDTSVGGAVYPFMNASGKIAAHEIGHLLGGRHEESNCAEGVHSELAPEGDVASPCTLMWPATGLSIDFGTVEAAVVRGYAREFAAP